MSMLCETLGVGRSAYYAWRQDELGTRQREDNRLMPMIRSVFREHRGGQYAGVDYRKMLARAGMPQSMSRADNCYDNAFMESCFGTVKTDSIWNLMRRNGSRERNSPIRSETTIPGEDIRHSVASPPKRSKPDPMILDAGSSDESIELAKTSSWQRQSRSKQNSGASSVCTSRGCRNPRTRSSRVSTSTCSALRSRWNKY